MSFAWSGLAFAELLAAGFLATLSALVFVPRPHRLQNRLLAALLFVEALSHAAAGLWFAATDPALARALILTDWSALFLAPPLYLAFTGTLESPLARPLSGRSARIALAGAALALQGLLHARPELFLAGLRVGTSTPYAPVEAAGSVVFFVSFGLVALFALFVSVSAWRRAARGTAVRSRARAFAFAFGVRDLMLLALVVVGTLTVGLGWLAPPDALFLAFWPTWAILFGALISYGILKHQLFDIDLKIKWTLRRGTMAAAFVAVFFGVSEAAAQLLGDATGSAYWGIAAAALLVFALAPLQRLADRVADAAMPRVQDTEEYRLVRKRAVYRAAVESASEDGGITQKERAMLATLSDQLGLTAKEAFDLEREAAAERGVS